MGQHGPTMIVWLPGRRPYCSSCMSPVSIYIVFMQERPVFLGTWCVSCDPYSSNTEHWASWKAEHAPEGVAEHGELRVPLEDGAWEFARKFMQGDGERRTRPSPSS